jgi:hypothetical protein
MTVFRMAVLAAAVSASATVVPAVAQQSGRPNTAPQGAAPQTPGATAPQGQLADATVQKVGKALRSMATIRQEYTEKAQSTKSPDQQKELTDQAQSSMVKAIGDQGLSVQQYNQVIQMAQADPNLKERLLSVAQSGE